MKAPSAVALDLPWLCPSAAALAALARSSSAAVWTELRHDPGCVLLLARVQATHESQLLALESVCPSAAVLEACLNGLSLHGEQGWVDWQDPFARTVLGRALSQATLAERLALTTEVSPAQAWTAALLSPLSWFALAGQGSGSELALPASEHTALTRRLCRNWRLPAWLSAVIGHLNLPVALAVTLGATPRLFQVVQLAVALIGERQPAIEQACGADAAELCLQLGLARADVEAWAEVAETTASSLIPALWQKPSEVPLLQDLLHLAVTQRRQGDGAWIERLQQEVDLLQQALDQQRADEHLRLERIKLAALAELAAGAGHEINNPLAVISGQAQYILKHLHNLENEWQDDPAAAAWLDVWRTKVGRSLQTIVGQTQRIHHVLTDLMQFARPNAPRSQEVRLVTLIHEVVASAAPLAQDKHLRVELPQPPHEWITQADPVQLRSVLASLVRNAIEAAPPEGSVSLNLSTASDGLLEVRVEDNGPGPSASAIEHLFDPFYSGRSAGRGRGLGLSTAWRLARQNSGDIRFAGIHDGRTRFVLILPARETPHLGYFANGQNLDGEASSRSDAALRTVTQAAG
jgi:signal transduction histidine kinase